MTEITTRRQKIQNHFANHRRLYTAAAVVVTVGAVVTRIPVPKPDVSNFVDLRLHKDWLLSMQETRNGILFEIPDVGDYMLTYVPNHA